MGSKLTHLYEETNYFRHMTVDELFDSIYKRVNQLKNYEIPTNDEKKMMFKRSPLDQNELAIANGIIYVTWVSPCWGFVDDIVFIIGKIEKDGEEKTYVKAKSVSRKGQYDFGKNKNHIEELLNFNG